MNISNSTAEKLIHQNFGFTIQGGTYKTKQSALQALDVKKTVVYVLCITVNVIVYV